MTACKGVSVIGVAILLGVTIAVAVLIAMAVMGAAQSSLGDVKVDFRDVRALEEGGQVCLYYTAAVVSGRVDGIVSQYDDLTTPTADWTNITSHTGLALDAGESASFKDCGPMPSNIRVRWLVVTGNNVKVFGPTPVTVQ